MFFCLVFFLRKKNPTKTVAFLCAGNISQRFQNFVSELEAPPIGGRERGEKKGKSGRESERERARARLCVLSKTREGERKKEGQLQGVFDGKGDSTSGRGCTSGERGAKARPAEEVARSVGRGRGGGGAGWDVGSKFEKHRDISQQIPLHFLSPLSLR